MNASERISYMIIVSCIFEFCVSRFLHWESVDAPFCSLIILNMLVFVDSVLTQVLNLTQVMNIHYLG